MEALPKEEQLLVWQETERNFWDEMKRQWSEEQDEAENKHHQTTLEIKVEVARLNGQCSQLAETQRSLAKQLAQVEAELSRTAQERDEKSNTLNIHEVEYREQQQQRLAKREQVRKAMTDYFRNMRGEDGPAGTEGDGATAELHDEVAARDTMPMQGVVRTGLPVGSTNSQDTTHAAAAPAAASTNGNATSHSPADVLVNVVDADGRVIGPVERIQPWNQWVEAIQNMPIRRPVKIRRGRKFNQDHLGSIYERTEAKGVKWLSCMIQATGFVQSKRCVSCDKNQGAFDDCIILGGDLFSKCGNCEWNRQGCHGASGESMDTGLSRSKRSSNASYTDLPDESTREEDDLRLRRKHAAEAALAKAAGFGLEPTIETESFGHIMTNGKQTSQNSQEPEQLPTPSEPKDFPCSGFTPANGRSRPPSHDAPTPTNASTEMSPQPNDTVLEEITSENLILRNDGTVYTYPDCVQGVPIVKINEDHPYWDPSWPNVKSIIEPALQIWKAKNQAVLDEESKGEKKGSAKYQTGRQVNRGFRILEFLEEGEISPYQLLSKRYTQSGKGGITSYDTLFRLSETLFELSKFNLDVKPVDWLRHRLHELIVEKGPDFNYAKIMHDFYHDEKLSALRAKRGFKNIGRPSGGKHARQSLGSVASTPRPLSKKRKSMRSPTRTPRDTPSLDNSPRVPYAALPQESPFNTQLQKRPKYIAPAPETTHDDDFRAGDFTDTDSLCGAPVMPTDWRLYQVKTRLYTSSNNVTQYWAWQPDERRYEHQVLTELEPVRWGTLKEPINFNMALDEIAEIEWNIDALRIRIIMHKDKNVVMARKDGKPRGDVMAAFKRPRTMRRFLWFCRELQIKLVKVEAAIIERQWDLMDSEHLPDRDEDASEELRE